MPLSDEDEAIGQIKALPEAVRLHLSHVARNGMSNILSAIRCGCNCKGRECGAEKALFEFEAKIKELGL